MSYNFEDYGSGSVRFAYKRNIDTTWTYTGWIARSGAGSDDETVYNLDSNTLYDFMAQLQYDSTIIDGNVEQFTTDKVPPTVTTMTAIGATTDEATLRMSYNFGDYDPGDLRFAYRVSGTPGWDTTNWYHVDVVSGNLNWTIDNLDSNTPYDFRAELRYDSNEIQGNILQFTTLQAPPDVSTRPVSFVGTNSATIEGYLEDPGDYGTVTVSFVWGPESQTDPESYPEEIAGEPSTLDDQGEFSADLSNLDSQEDYYYRARAEAGSITVYGDEESFITGMVLPEVTTENPSSITTSGATVNMTYDFHDYVSGDLRFAYTISGTEDDWLYTDWVPASGSGSYDVALTGLDSYTPYTYKAQLRYDTDKIIEGLEKRFVTAMEDPTVITNEATDVTTSEATLHMYYDFADYGQGEVCFEYRKLGDTVWAYTAWSEQSGHGNYLINLDGRDSDTVYEFRAKLRCDSIEKEGAILQFTTLKVPPLIVTDDASDITSYSATLHGSLEGMGDYTSVDVSFEWGINPGEYTASTDPETLYGMDSFSADLSDLNSSTTYYYRAIGQADGEVFPGLEEEFTTEMAIVVNFPDPNLEALIREAIGKPTGDIYDTDLIVLTSLSGYNRGISDLTGIEYCINLSYLGLSDNQISNISPLQNLHSLTGLNLSHNQISDISPLQNLHSLTMLVLSYNYQISNIFPLQNLTSLTWLYLHYNQISNISPLQNLTSLTGLYLNSNQISDISWLQNLTSLTVLHLGSNQISNISWLQNLHSLTVLYLNNNLIENISWLQNLHSLTVLHLGGNQISNISWLQNLTSLTELGLSGNQISDISWLQNLTSLTELYLDSNQIINISPLQNLHSLSWLDLTGNQISDISPLQNLTSLIGLYLAVNQISDISPLQNLTSLNGLYLAINQISDISPLQNLTSLVWLELAGNQISDISPLVANTGLDTGDEVYLYANPLSPESLYIHIPDLQDRDVIVYYDEQPVSVTTDTVADVTADSATLRGELVSMGAHDSMEVSFEWGTESGVYTENTTPETLDTESPFSFALGDLDSKTTYYYRAKATGVITFYGDEVEFTTEKIKPTVTTNPATDITDITAVLHGELKGLGDYSSVNVSFEYAWTGDPGTIYETDPKTMTHEGSFSANVSGLTPASEYAFVAKAVANGVTVYGAERDFTTYALPLEVWVDDDYTADTPGWGHHAFASIHEGIIGVEEGVGTVHVYDGEYAEYVEVNKSINLKSVVGPGVTTVAALPYEDFVFWVASNSVNITGFTVTGNNTAIVGIILYQVSDCNISDCIVNDSEAGIYLYEADNNRLENNTIQDNTCGIYVQNSHNNEILGNNILNSIYTGAPWSGTGIYLESGYDTGNVIQFNNIVGNSSYGVSNVNPTENVSAENNWWGDANGPGGAGPGNGDNVTSWVDYDPWLGAEVGAYKSEAITDDGTLDAAEEADVEVIVTGSANVTVARYDSNPGAAFSGDIDKYVDIHIDDAAGVTEIEIRLYYTNADITGKVESSLKLHWWDSSTLTWVLCSDTGVNTTDVGSYSGYIWARITGTSTPKLSDLSGTPFGASGRTPPPSTGGPGAPSDGGGPREDAYITVLVNDIGQHDGVLWDDVVAPSVDGLLKLYLTEDTVCLNRNGIYLFSIRVTTLAEPGPTPEYMMEMVGHAYKLGPSGATFAPPVTLAIEYLEALVPAGVLEKNLFIAYWDENKLEWTIADSTADPAGNIVTTQIDHFSTYAVMASTRPAEFSVTDLSVVPDEIDVGEETTISVMVANTGDLTASYGAILKINDAVTKTIEVTLDGGASQRVSFSITPDAAGKFTISIGGLSGSLEVKEPEGVVAEVPEPKPPAPAPEPKPPVEEKPVTPAPPPEEEVKEVPVEPEADYWYWWLIGAVVVIVIVGLLYYQFRWRRQKA